MLCQFSVEVLDMAKTELFKRRQAYSRGEYDKKRVTFEGMTSLPVSVVIIDTSGTIVSVNKIWEHFGRRNGLRIPHSAVGLNYLHYCPTDEPNSRRFVTELKALLAGRRDLLTFVYPCHSRTQARWFCLIGLPLSQSKAGGVALLHINVTTMLPGHGAKEANAQVHQLTSTFTMGGILQRSVLEPLSSHLTEMFARTLKESRSGSDLMNAAGTPLSKRQMEILKLLGQGKTNKEIATALFRSPNTIKLHVSAILKRLKLRSRVQAAILSSELLQDPNFGAKTRSRGD
jgi:DNA-binding CsgD family transcriptional regulator